MTEFEKRKAQETKENARVCLHCTLPECLGTAECLREQKAAQRRKYQAERRRGQAALEYAYNVAQSDKKREQRKAVMEKLKKSRGEK